METFQVSENVASNCVELRVSFNWKSRDSTIVQRLSEYVYLWHWPVVLSTRVRSYTNIYYIEYTISFVAENLTESFNGFSRSTKVKFRQNTNGEVHGIIIVPVRDAETKNRFSPTRRIQHPIVKRNVCFFSSTNTDEIKPEPTESPRRTLLILIQ